MAANDDQMTLSCESKTWQTVDTKLYADSVEWCPYVDNHHVLLCGTYQLDNSQEDKDENHKKNQIRIGQLMNLHLNSNSPNELQENRQPDNESNDIPLLVDPHLSTKSVIDMPGILDIKWSPHKINDIALFGLVNSVGELRLYEMGEVSDNFEELSILQLGDQCLGLSLDWSNRIDRNDTRLVTSTSDGCIQVHSASQRDLRLISSWKAHDYEAWICAFNYWNTNIIYTGGDDCRLRIWDCRMPTDNAANIANIRRDCGVTSIQCHPTKDNVLCTGGYDEDLLLWDTRQMRRPQSSLNLGGGIWRIKWEPDRGQYLLTATMYNGYHVIENNSEGLMLVNHYNKGGALCYGADWCFLQDKSTLNSLSITKTTKTIATCSFYEHSLQLWSVYINKGIIK